MKEVQCNPSGSDKMSVCCRALRPDAAELLTALSAEVQITQAEAAAFPSVLQDLNILNWKLLPVREVVVVFFSFGSVWVTRLANFLSRTTHRGQMF